MKRSLAVLLFLLIGLAFAAGTPAGTSIENQASATYIDSSGNPRVITSNLVTTVVQAVYGVSLLPDGTAAAPGQTRLGLGSQTVYFNFVLANTGNAPDTILLTAANLAADDFNLASLAVYVDANGNGILDPGETTPVTSVALAADAVVNLIVAGVIPAGTPSGSIANLDLTGTSSGDPAAQDTGNVARALVTSGAVLTLTKSAAAGVAPGDTFTYTLSGSNIGGGPAHAVSGVMTVNGTPLTGILVTDVLPAGLEFVSGSLSGSAGAGTLTLLYSADGGATWTSTEPPSGVNAVGMVLVGSGAFLPQGASYTLSFGIRAPSPVAAGTSYANVAALRFDTNGDGDANDAGEEVTSNTTTTTVTGTYALAVGPFGFPGGGASGMYAAEGYTVTRSGDAQTVTSASSGTWVTFRHTLRNDGNSSDTFAISVSGVPSSWTVQRLQSDGTTPLFGNLGPVAPGSTADFFLRVFIPPAYTNGTPQSFTVTATSAGSGMADATTDTIGTVTLGFGVDLAATGAAGDGDSSNDTPPSASADPGTSVTYALDVYNAGNNGDSFALSATVPAGWTVGFYLDANGNGVLDAGDAPIVSTSLLGAGNTQKVLAVVNVPAGTVPGARGLTFTATSNTVGAVSDAVATTLSVREVASISFTPDRSSTITSPGVIDFSHTLTNGGNAAATVNLPAFTSAWGWTYEYSVDGGVTFNASLTNVVIPAGGSVSVLVRVIAPAGEPDARSEAATLTASASYPGGSTASSSVIVTTTIQIGELRFTKSVDKPSVAPGDTLTYTINAQNVGTGPLGDVKISDPVPAYTDFVSVSATTSMAGTVLYSTDGAAWSSSAPLSVPVGGGVYVGVSTNGDTVITDADLMQPAATITVTLVVRVR